MTSQINWRGAARRASHAFLTLALLVLTPAWAAEDAAKKSETFSVLDSKVQSLKKQVMELNRDLFVLEEELLFPASTQLAVFLSVDVGQTFQLDSVQVKLNDKVVTNYLYTERELQALHRGGMQRLYLGNLPVGKHELVAFFTGKGPHERDYRRGTTLVFEKGTEPKYIELQIRDVEAKLQPEFRVKDWQ
jgi:hypothetical protein